MYEASKKDDATLIVSSFQCRRDGGRKPVQITGARRSGRGAGDHVCWICFHNSR